jgi:cytochrome c biogenesis protein ResB
VRVQLASQQVPLGFGITLLDFDNPTYGGTTMAARYRSQVRINDPAHPDGGFETEIAMNQPLDHGPFRIFQSGFEEPEGGPQISIFSVAYDPGTPVVYVGSVVLIAGILIIFYLPKHPRRRSSAAQADLEQPANAVAGQGAGHADQDQLEPALPGRADGGAGLVDPRRE